MKRERRLVRRGQIDFQLLGGAADPSLIDQIEPFQIELAAACDHLLHDFGKIVAAETAVAGGGADLHDALVFVEDGNVEGAAAEVEHQILALGGVREAMGQGRRGRLVDQPLDLQARQPARIDRRLALVIVEIGRDGNDHFGHRRLEIGFGILLERAEHELR